MKPRTTHTIGHVARAANISVRALRHYDEIGLVKPSGRSTSGYRLYTDADLARLQQVMFFRELGFRLEDIAPILANPSFDRKSALLEQRTQLAENAARANALVRLIDKTIESLTRGDVMTAEEMFEGFDPAKHEEEAQARWGATPEFAESKRRTKGYTKDDWKQIRSEADAITAAFAAAMASGVKASDGAAMDVAEQHRKHIDRWFYACSYKVHVGLGEMYVADARFAANYEKVREGLTEFVCAAIRANAERAGNVGNAGSAAKA